MPPLASWKRRCMTPTTMRTSHRIGKPATKVIKNIGIRKSANPIFTIASQSHSGYAAMAMRLRHNGNVVAPQWQCDYAIMATWLRRNGNDLDGVIVRQKEKGSGIPSVSASLSLYCFLMRFYCPFSTGSAIAGVDALKTSSSLSGCLSMAMTSPGRASSDNIISASPSSM